MFRARDTGTSAPRCTTSCSSSAERLWGAPRCAFPLLLYLASHFCVTQCIYLSVSESQLPHKIINLLFTITGRWGDQRPAEVQRDGQHVEHRRRARGRAAGLCWVLLGALARPPLAVRGRSHAGVFIQQGCLQFRALGLQSRRGQLARRGLAGTPCTLHPAPCTLHPAPCTLHPRTHAPAPSAPIGCTSCSVKSFRSRRSFLSSPLWTP
jgi:hypothetical protein